MKKSKLNQTSTIIADVVLTLAVIIGLIIGGLDLAGANFTAEQQISWLNKPQTLTLLIVCLILTSLIIERRIFFRKIETKLEILETKISFELDEKQLRGLFDENLVEIFGERVIHVLKQIEKAKKEKIITLEGEDDITYWFPKFYIKTLKAFPKSHFIATSIPSNSYFWRNEDVINEIKGFTQTGKMDRVFFLSKESQLKNTEIVKIIKNQIESGVNVYCCDSTKLPAHLRDKVNKVFFVDRGKNIGWSADVLERTQGKVKEKIIVKVRATSDKETIRKNIEIFDEILSLRSVTKKAQIAEEEVVLV